MNQELLPEELQQLEVEFEEELSDRLLIVFPSVDFADLPSDATVEQLDVAAIAILRYLLQEGDRGYKDSIDAITDEDGRPPSEDNAWLWDDEDGEYRGKFVDRREEGDRWFSFWIQPKGGGTWLKEIRLLSGIG